MMRRFLLALVLFAAPLAGQNLAEIATTNDDYSVCTEPSDDKMLCNFALVPPYRQYDADRPPTTCAACDEFTGDAETLTWRWGNQGTSTISYFSDGAYIVPQMINNVDLRVRWTTGPDGSATDFVVTAKMHNSSGALLHGGGLILLATGSEATPTKIYTCTVAYYGGGATLGFRSLWTSIFNSYTSFASNESETLRVGRMFGPHYLRMRYDSSAKELFCAYSSEGLSWYEQAATVLAAHPTTSMGFFTDQTATSTPDDWWVDWWRARSDATGIAAPYPTSD